MGKKWIIILTLTVGIILAIVCGIYAYNKGGISDSNVISNKKLADVMETENSITEEVMNESVPTSLTNSNISPNAIIIEKRYYKACDHLIKDVIDVPEELVNKTEADIKEKYAGWKIEGYSPTEIAVYKEFKGFCDEHYMIRENNGIISIYTVNQEGVEKLKENTEISTMYLPDEDLKELKSGIEIIGKTNLYSFLEDYE